MRRAQERDAARSQKFLFNTSATPELGRDTYGEMTMDEIVNGKVRLSTFLHPRPSRRTLTANLLHHQGDEFEGLMGLIRRYLDSLGEADQVAERREVEIYLDLVSKRAKGNFLHLIHALDSELYGIAIE